MAASREELRAALYWKRITEISSAATKTAVVSLGTLAIVWFGQLQPQYHLLYRIYPQLQSSYSDVNKTNEDLEFLEDRIRREWAKKQTPKASGDNDKVSVKSIENVQAQAETTKKAQGSQAAELANLVNSVSFEVFGLKLPVPLLWGSVAWNLILLVLLLYLAYTRAKVWRLCGAALTLTKQHKRAEDLDDVAGSGPFWIAPVPRLRTASQTESDPTSATIEDPQRAFGWAHLKTLPAIAATAAFLLLGLLQLAVTSQGLAAISAARTFTDQLPGTTSPGRRQTATLEERISNFTSSLTKNDGNPDAATLAAEPKLAQLVIRPAEASLISLLLILMIIGTVVLVVWWFRPWTLSATVTSERPTPRRAVAWLLVIASGVTLSSLLAWLVPALGGSLGDVTGRILPTVTRFLAASVTTFCVLELVSVAFSGSQRMVFRNARRAN